MKKTHKCPVSPWKDAQYRSLSGDANQSRVSCPLTRKTPTTKGKEPPPPDGVGEEVQTPELAWPAGRNAEPCSWEGRTAERYHPPLRPTSACAEPTRRREPILLTCVHSNRLRSSL